MTEHEKVIKYKAIYEEDGTPTIKLTAKTKLTKKEIAELVESARIQYPGVVEHYNKTVNNYVKQCGKYFDAWSEEKGLFKVTYTLDGMNKEEYLNKKAKEYMRTNGKLSMDCVKVIQPTIDFRLPDELLIKDLKKQYPDMSDKDIKKYLQQLMASFK